MVKSVIKLGLGLCMFWMLVISTLVILDSRIFYFSEHIVAIEDYTIHVYTRSKVQYEEL